AAGEHARRGASLAVADFAETRVGNRRLGAVFADGRGEEEATRAAAVRLLAANKGTALVGGPGAAGGRAPAPAARPPRGAVRAAGRADHRPAGGGAQRRPGVAGGPARGARPRPGGVRRPSARGVARRRADRRA